MDVKTRGAALYELLSKPKYRGVPGYTEDRPATVAACRVNHVVVCAQPAGEPMYAVFKASEHAGDGEGRGKPRGHLLLFEADGTFIPCFSGANSIDGEFRDVDEDGTVEAVESWGYGFGAGPTVQVLHVIPVTRDPAPVLAVVYDWDGSGEAWNWHVEDATATSPAKIHLGPAVEGAKRCERKVTYTWAADRGAWEGPEGDDAAHFKRVDGARRELAEAFSSAKAAAAARQ